MPGRQEMVYAFGEYLSGMLNPSLVPQGFNMAAEFALYNLQSGVSPIGQPVPSELSGYPPQIYNFLRAEVLDIAEAVCPEDFARGVRDFYDSVRSRIRAKEAKS